MPNAALAIPERAGQQCFSGRKVHAKRFLRLQPHGDAQQRSGVVCGHLTVSVRIHCVFQYVRRHVQTHGGTQREARIRGGDRPVAVRVPGHKDAVPVVHRFLRVFLQRGGVIHTRITVEGRHFRHTVQRVGNALQGLIAQIICEQIPHRCVAVRTGTPFTHVLQRRKIRIAVTPHTEYAHPGKLAYVVPFFGAGVVLYHVRVNEPLAQQRLLFLGKPVGGFKRKQVQRKRGGRRLGHESEAVAELQQQSAYGPLRRRFFSGRGQLLCFFGRKRRDRGNGVNLFDRTGVKIGRRKIHRRQGLAQVGLGTEPYQHGEFVFLVCNITRWAQMDHVRRARITVDKRVQLLRSERFQIYRCEPRLFFCICERVCDVDIRHLRIVGKRIGGGVRSAHVGLHTVQPVAVPVHHKPPVFLIGGRFSAAGKYEHSAEQRRGEQYGKNFSDLFHCDIPPLCDCSISVTQKIRFVNNTFAEKVFTANILCGILASGEKI